MSALTAAYGAGHLAFLETDRLNSARSRNTRLAALRSLFRYAALRHPEHPQLIAQVLAIPQKRFDKTSVSFLQPAKSMRCSPPQTGLPQKMSTQGA